MKTGKRDGDWRGKERERKQYRVFSPLCSPEAGETWRNCGCLMKTILASLNGKQSISETLAVMLAQNIYLMLVVFTSWHLPIDKEVLSMPWNEHEPELSRRQWQWMMGHCSLSVCLAPSLRNRSHSAPWSLNLSLRAWEITHRDGYILFIYFLIYRLDLLYCTSV